MHDASSIKPESFRHVKLTVAADHTGLAVSVSVMDLATKYSERHIAYQTEGSKKGSS
jgi:hypothetical protein